MANDKLKNLAPGTVFDAGPIDMMILEHLPNGLTLLISERSIATRPFYLDEFDAPAGKPKAYPNDWRFSYLRQELNSVFLKSFDDADGAILVEDIPHAEWDLYTTFGDDGYGYSVDKIGLLSETMFHKYSLAGTLSFGDEWWLLTPDDKDETRMKRVTQLGRVCTGSARFEFYGVRPAFYVRSELQLGRRSDPDDIDQFAGFSTMQILNEAQRRLENLRTDISTGITELEEADGENDEN